MEESPSEKYPVMEDESMKISWVEISKADNGFTVSWNEREKKPKGSMEHCESTRHSLVFGLEEEDKAWETFVKYKKSELNNKESY